MQFVRADAAAGVERLATALQTALKKHKRVLWFISGGSNIPLSVEVIQQVPDELTKGLVIMPIDERYGPVGHLNSNTQQLYDAGFAPKQATFIPVLTGASLCQTVEAFDHALQIAFAKIDTVIAQIGIGGDGHISGILPGSPALTAPGLAYGYEWADYTRVTTTLQALRHIADAYVFAYGDGKHDVLQRLRDQDLPLTEQPAQFLKSLPSVYVYNDQLK